MRGMGKIAACTVSFIPVQSSNYIADVNKVLDIIGSSGLQYVTGSFSTEIYGDASDICRLISLIYNEMDEGCSFVMDVRFSNVCGCQIQKVNS